MIHHIAIPHVELKGMEEIVDVDLVFEAYLGECGMVKKKRDLI